MIRESPFLTTQLFRRKPICTTSSSVASLAISFIPLLRDHDTPVQTQIFHLGDVLIDHGQAMSVRRHHAKGCLPPL